MRCESAAVAKRGRGKAQRAPREGTLLRGIFDRLQANKGKIVEMGDLHPSPPSKRTLEDFYGLDIRCFGKPYHRGRLWCLAGEWFGKVYVDYVALTQVDR